MTLKAIIASLTDVDEKYRDIYKPQSDGKFRLVQIEGLVHEGDVATLKTSLTQERQAHSETKAKLKPLESFMTDGVEKVVERLNHYDELKAISSTDAISEKIKLASESRIASATGPLTRERDSLLAAKSDLEKQVFALKNAQTASRIESEVRSAASKLKVSDTAIADVLLRAERIFTVDDATGKVVVKSDARGVTPGITTDLWLEDLKASAPHFWPASHGGGANGSLGGSGGVNPWSAAGWNMTEQGRIYNNDPSKAESLAKAAGTSIGGAKPAAK